MASVLRFFPCRAPDAVGSRHTGALLPDCGLLENYAITLFRLRQVQRDLSAQPLCRAGRRHGRYGTTEGRARQTENVMVLPPMDDSLDDKVFLFKAVRHMMPMFTATAAERRRSGIGS
jgi:hypothetical protein